MEITRFTLEDFEGFWPIYKHIVSAQETYAIDPDISYDEAFESWCLEPQFTYVSKDNGAITGSYYLKPNANGPGGHVCNCGYMVSEKYRGRGIAKMLCQHSQQVALDAGFMAMQFNSVVSTNESALHLWRELGFSIIGTVPKGYKHKREGLVDAYIMYKLLA